jgi:hypothetical protein
MAKQEVDEVDELEEDLEVLEADDLVDEELDEELEVVAVDVADEEVEDEAPATAQRSTEEEDDEIPDADDVEASLDVILKERLVVEDEPEDEEAVEVDERGEATERVLPKQADEFVCNSCFLVKNTSQLADKKKGLCRDCA